MLFEAPYQFLVLDDDPSIHDYISEIVKRTSNLNEKLNLIHCNNWKSAMDELEKGFIHIVLLDLYLEGKETFKDIRNLKMKETGLKIITCSSDVTLETLFACYKNGSDFHIKKPFEKSHFIETIEQCLNNISYWKKIFI